MMTELLASRSDVKALQTERLQFLRPEVDVKASQAAQMVEADKKKEGGASVDCGSLA